LPVLCCCVRPSLLIQFFPLIFLTAPTYSRAVHTPNQLQRNLRSPAAVAGGGTGLDFPCFLKFLVMIAYHALSKTNSFSSLYSTIEVGQRLGFVDELCVAALW
jgi:hypothetical protein